MAGVTESHAGNVERVVAAAVDIAHRTDPDVYRAIESLIAVADRRPEILDAAWQSVQHGLQRHFTRTGERAALLLRLAWVRLRHDLAGSS